MEPECSLKNPHSLRLYVTAYLLVYTVNGRNPLPTPRTKLELYPLSDVCDCLF